MEKDSKPYNIDRFKSLYDQLSIIKFDTEDPKFWTAEPIMRCLYFINASDTDYNESYYIDIGKIFTEIPDIPKEDIMAAEQIEDERLIRFVNKQLHEHCDLPLLEVEELIFYDFSIIYLSDNGKPYIREKLKGIYQSYPDHIDDKCFFAIMSCLCSHAKREQISSGAFNISPVDINKSELVEDFYILV